MIVQHISPTDSDSDSLSHEALSDLDIRMNAFECVSPTVVVADCGKFRHLKPSRNAMENNGRRRSERSFPSLKYVAFYVANILPGEGGWNGGVGEIKGKSHGCFVLIICL